MTPLNIAADKQPLKKKLLTYSTRAAERSHITSLQLAVDGFEYGEAEGHVTCVDCGLKLTDFKQPVDTLVLHNIYSPNCPAAREGNESLQDSAETLCNGVTASSQVLRQPDSNPLSDFSEIPIATDSLSEHVTITRSSANSGQVQESDLLSSYKLLTQNRIKRCKQIVLSNMSTASGDLHEEKSRASTFQDINPEIGRHLAAEGLHYSVNHRRLSCMYCNFTKIMSASDIWNLQDISGDHLLTSAQCPILSGQQCGNVPDITVDTKWSYGKQRNNSDNQDGLEHLGINRKPAKYPKLAVIDRRKETFLTFPNNSRMDTAVLCSAGFFYSGQKMAVTCFSCGLVSDNWRANEDPYKRHARSSTSCQFMIDQKGRDFIDAAVEELGLYREPIQENKINRITQRMLRPRWDREVVQKAILMGMNRESVRAVVCNRIKKGEPDHTYLSELYKDIDDLVVPDSVLSAEPQILLPTVVQLPVDHQQTSASETPASTSTASTSTVLTSTVSTSTVSTSTVSTSATSTSATATLAALSNSLSSTFSTSSDNHLAEGGGESMRKQAKTVTSRLTCTVCMSDIVGIVFLPCAHIVCCVSCAAAMVRCPICRHEVRATIRADFRHLG